MSKLTIYMKSGNVIKLRFVKTWEVQSTSSGISKLTIVRKQVPFSLVERLVVPTINLSQIEAITETYGIFDR